MKILNHSLRTILFSLALFLASPLLAGNNNIAFEDNFDRPDGPNVENGWVELNTENITLEGNRVKFSGLPVQNPPNAPSLFRFFSSGEIPNPDQAVVRTTIRYSTGLFQETFTVRILGEDTGSTVRDCALIYSQALNELTLRCTIKPLIGSTTVIEDTLTLPIPLDGFANDLVLELRSRPAFGTMPSGYNGLVYVKGTQFPQVQVSIDTDLIGFAGVSMNVSDILAANFVLFADDFQVLSLIDNCPTDVSVVNQVPTPMGLSTGVTVTDLDGFNDPVGGVDFSTFELKINGILVDLNINDCVNLGLCSPVVVSPDQTTAVFLIFFDLSNFCVEASVFDFLGIQYTGDNKP